MPDNVLEVHIWLTLQLEGWCVKVCMWVCIVSAGGYRVTEL